MTTAAAAIRFTPGQVLATSALISALEKQDGDHNVIHSLLARHLQGDWGTVCAEDKRTNEYALKNGERILSRYEHGEISIYIITEWDRSYTTIMRVQDY